MHRGGNRANGHWSPIESGSALILLATTLLAVVAAYALTHSDAIDPATEREWIAALRASDVDLRAVAAYKAGAAAQPAPALVRELAALVRDTSAAVRREVILSLIRIGRRSPSAAADVASALQPILSDAEQPSARIHAARILGLVGPRAVGAAAIALDVSLGSADAELRAASANALAEITTASDQIVHHLAARTGDTAAIVRAAAVEALLRLRPDAASSAIAVVMLRDSSELVRIASVYALALGAADAATITALESAAGDRSAGVRRGAAAALDQLGRGGRARE